MANGNRPEGLDAFNSLFGIDAPQETPKPEPPAAKENVRADAPTQNTQNQGASSGNPAGLDDDFLKGFEAFEESKAQEKAEEKPQEEPADSIGWDIDSMFESVSEEEKTEVKEPPAPAPQVPKQAPPPPAFSDTEKLQQVVSSPAPENSVYENSGHAVRSRGSVKPIRKKVSQKSLERIIGNIVTGGEVVRQSNGASIVIMHTGEIVALESDVNIIGSSRTQANIALAGNNTISRRHAVIEAKAGRYYLRDLGSLNGTRLNGVQLQPNQEQELKNGDKILISNEPFEFRTDL